MWQDPTTNLDKTATRWYEAVNAVFLGPDPLGFGGGQTNLSEFCGNSPANHTDPSGMSWYNPLSWLGSAIDFAGNTAGDIGQGLSDHMDANTTPTDQNTMQNGTLGMVAQLSREQGIDFRYGGATRSSVEFVPDGGHWEVDSDNIMTQHKIWVSDNPVALEIGKSGGSPVPVTGGHYEVTRPPSPFEICKAVTVAGINTAMSVLPAANSVAEGFSIAGSGLAGQESLQAANLLRQAEDAPAAAQGTRWGPATGAGPLGEQVANTFRGGSYINSVDPGNDALPRLWRVGRAAWFLLVPHCTNWAASSHDG